MYNFKDKIGVGKLNYQFDNIHIYNKDYIPFSMLFNLNTSFYGNYTLSYHLGNYKFNKKRVDILKLESELTNWINDVHYIIFRYNENNRALISKFYEHIISSLHFTQTSLRHTTNYLRGYYSLFEKDLKECYFVLLVKKEYIQYIKLSILLNEPILEDCFEFWYDEKLILEKNDLKVKRVTNKILKELSLIDIPCYNKVDILNLLQPEIRFDAPTISKQKELLSKFIEEFQQEELNNIK